MSLNNTVIFAFMTMLNIMLAIALSSWGVLMWKSDEKLSASMMGCLAIILFLFIEYLLIGGLLQ